MTTGYAFALIAMLERGGLKPGEYDLYPLGGALERFKALQEKRYAGALFNPSENREAVAGFIRAFLRAVAWIYDPPNREAAFDIFRRFLRDGAVDLEGLRSVRKVRSKYGKPKKALTEPMTYFDPSFLAQALNN